MGKVTHTVLAEGLPRLYGAGAELAESVFPSDDTGTFTSYKLRFVTHGGATKHAARFRIILVVLQKHVLGKGVGA